MFTPSMNVASLVDDLYYWLVFLCIVLAVPGILLAFTQKASILCCVFIGTYTTILPIGASTCVNHKDMYFNRFLPRNEPEIHLYQCATKSHGKGIQ